MALVADAPVNPEMTLNAIIEVAKNTGRDSFQLTLFRKEPGGMFPKTIATFADACAAHIQHAQLWLPDIAGGGQFQIRAFHCDDLAKPIGGFVSINVDGDPRPIDPEAPMREGWRGPKLISGGGIRREPTPLMGVSMPPGSAASQPARPLGSGGMEPPPSSAAYLDRERYELAQQRAALAAEAQRLREREDRDREERNREREDRHKGDLRNLEERHASQLAGLKAELTAAAPKSGGAGEVVTGLVTALAPVLEKVFSASAAAQAEAAKASAAATERLAAMQQENAKEMRELIRSLGEKREDPMGEKMLALTEKMMNKDNAAAAEAAKMMASMTEMVGGTMNMAMNAMAQVRELMQPAEDQGEPPIVKIVGRVADMIQASAEAARAQAEARGVRAEVARRRAATRSAPPAPPAPAAVPPAVTPPQVTAAPPTPAQPAAAAVATPPAQSFGDAGTPADPATGTPAVPAAPPPPPPAPAAAPAVQQPFVQLIQMIRHRRDVDQTANFFWDRVQDPSIAGPLSLAEMQPMKMLHPYLEKWLAESGENREYLSDFVTAISEIGVERGLLPVPEGEEDEADGEEEEPGDAA